MRNQSLSRAEDVTPVTFTKEKKARPFLKWAGGKQQLLEQLQPLFPCRFERYIEPFVGGGAVYFHLWNHDKITPGQAFLFDINAELINTYQVVRDHVDELIALLAQHARHHSRAYYYRIRGLDRRPGCLTDPIERAARMIYLNKTCYNGLYRVNRRGEFNVPMGSYRNPQILQAEVLREASMALQDAFLDTKDFRSILEIAKPGDFIYFDSPYVPLSDTSNFTSYTSRNFGIKEQEALAEVFSELTARGCYCMLSNSYTPLVLDLYDQYRIEIVYANRAINSKANSRGPVKEAVVLNYS